MSANYQHLALAEIKPGMILSDVLKDAQGQVLLAEGTVLTEAMLTLLPRHGIEGLAVACSPPSEEEQAAYREAMGARLAWLFRKNDIDDHGDWATGILRRYVEDFRLGREIEQ